MKLNSIYKKMEEKGIDKNYLALLNNNVEYILNNSTIKLLSIAAILIEREEIEYKKLAYYIILKYSIISKDYTPIYDISYKLLNMPVIELINKIDNIKSENTIFDEIYNIIKNKCKENNNYYTGNQKKMKIDFFKEDIETSVIAPTSFGKTDLIKEYILKNFRKLNICVIVPSKAMLNQLKFDILDMFKTIEDRPKIITHYDIMISENKRNIFIFTQERLYKFLYDKKINVKFDVLLIDEAHKLFDKDVRDKLLARIIILMKNANKKIIIKYFSPVISNSDNINFKYLKEKYKINNAITVNPLIKIEEIFYIDYIDMEKRIYDQFFNKFIYTRETFKDEYDYIIRESKEKNIIYFNKPRECIKKAFELSKKFSKNQLLEKVSKELQDFVHNDYDLAELVEKGIIYHNGIVPENIRLYLENIIKKDSGSEIKYVFATSTLLEGVNMPFDNMFIMDIYKGNGKMSYQDLKNLIGRVNRFSTIFSNKTNSINKLLPKIHFIKNKDKARNNFEDFIKENLKIESKSLKRNDNIRNPLLKSVNYEDKNEKNIIENLENNINREFKICTEVGKYCLENNITEFDIHENEEKIQNNINLYKSEKSNYSIVDLIYKIFIKDVKFINKDYELLRLENEEARNFYNMFINWKEKNVSYKEMINMILDYWKKNKTNFIYLGSKWGECKREENDLIPNYIRLIIKNDKEKVNYAIKKIKLENDFIEYKLLKYIEILYKIGIVDEKEYNKIKYGTSNNIQIYFQRDGLSQELSKKITKEYNNYIFEKKENEYGIDKKILNYFKENEVLRVELEYYL